MGIKKHTALIGLSSLIHTGLGFFSGILLTRMLGPEGRGALQKMDASVTLLAMLATMKVNVAITYFVANGKISRERVYGIGLTILGLGTLAVALTLLILKLLGHESLLLPVGYGGLFFAAYLLSLFFVRQLQLVLQGFLRGVKNFSEIYANTVFISIFRLVFFAVMFGVSMVIGRQYSTAEGLGFHWIVAFAGLAATAFFFRKNFQFKPDFQFSRAGDLAPFMSFTTASFLSLLCQFFNRKLDIWFVEGYAGVAQLGLYALAANLGELILVLPDTIREVMMPYFASGKREENIQHLRFFARMTFTLSLGVLGGLALFAPYFIPFLYGAEFTGAVLPFRILTIGLAFTGFGILFYTWNNSQGNPKFNLYANLAALAVTIALDLWLIPRHGIMGAAVASMLAYLTSAAIAAYTVFGIQKVPFGNYFILERADFAAALALVRGKLKRKK